MNVLAIEITEFPEPIRDRRGREQRPDLFDLTTLRVSGSAAAGLIPNVARPRGLQVWNADVMTGVFDLDYGNSTEPLAPIRIVGTRNGVFSGQIVVGSDREVRGLAAQVTALSRVDGAERIPASAVRVRYALPTGSERGTSAAYMGLRDVKRFDALAAQPPRIVPVRTRTGRGAKAAARFFGAVQPIWVTVSVPQDAIPGAYEGRLTLHAESPREHEPADPLNVQVPVHLHVHGWQLPHPKGFVTHVGFIQSPESVAMQYGVPRWSQRHWDLIARSLRHVASVGNETLYVPLICKTHFGNEESMVRWVRRRDGTYDHDFSVLERYVDAYLEQTRAAPRVLSLTVWDSSMIGTMGSRNTRPAEAPLEVSLLDRDTGRVTTMVGPQHGGRESQAFWGPVMAGIRKRLKARGIDDQRIHVGIAGDWKPDRATTDLFQRVAPYAKWVLSAHGVVSHIHGAPVGYATHVWRMKGVPNPGVARHHGWNREDLVNVFPRHGGLTNTTLWPDAPLGVHHAISEAAVAGYLRGFGRVGADFWPVLPSPRGKKTLINRYPASSRWERLQVGACTPAMLHPGPGGAVATARLEMLRQGIQECEARIFIDRALVDKTVRQKLGDAAAGYQALLDDRTRAYRVAKQPAWEWYAGRDWQDCTSRLYEAAAEVAAAMASEGPAGE